VTARIRLRVNPASADIGLTAAVSHVLADAGQVQRDRRCRTRLPLRGLARRYHALDLIRQL
jgi:hypothetical protein